MSKRISTLLLFATIAMLLTLKAGLNFSNPAGDDAHISAIATSTMPDTELQLEALPPTGAGTTEAGSLAMLESYLIPEAVAQTAPVSDQLIEDETLSSLRHYKDELDQRSKALDRREASLEEAEEQLKRRVTELEQLEASIQQRLNDESKIKSKKIKRLTAVYEGMKPERAAPVIEKMELATVVKIFLLMDEKKVGKILSFLPAEKAVVISQALTRQISTVK